MLDKNHLIPEAARLKIALVKRAYKMVELRELITRCESGLAPDIKPQRYETMLKEYDTLLARQTEERQTYATVRWALGITSTIDLNNLELER